MLPCCRGYNKGSFICGRVVKHSGEFQRGEIINLGDAVDVMEEALSCLVLL